jgi:hypothetical protein
MNYDFKLWFRRSDLVVIKETRENGREVITANLGRVTGFRFQRDSGWHYKVEFSVSTGANTDYHQFYQVDSLLMVDKVCSSKITPEQLEALEDAARTEQAVTDQRIAAVVAEHQAAKTRGQAARRSDTVTENKPSTNTGNPFTVVKETSSIGPGESVIEEPRTNNPDLYESDADTIGETSEVDRSEGDKVVSEDNTGPNNSRAVNSSSDSGSSTHLTLSGESVLIDSDLPTLFETLSIKSGDVPQIYYHK